MRKIRSKKVLYFMILFFCSSLLIFLHGSSLVHASEEDELKHVLFISSYSESFMSVPDQIAGIKSVFDGTNIILEIEYMDTRRLNQEENIDVFYESLSYKLDNLPKYDAVIVGDDAALQFALDYQDELFDQIPIIFLGINDAERAEIADSNPYMAGSMEHISVADNIALAQKLNPSAKKVVGIVDDTLTGQGEQKQFIAASAQFPNLDCTMISSSDYTFEELGQKLEAYDNDTILIFLCMNQDKTGNYIELERQFLLIKQHTKIPVYRATVGGVGHGILGGKLVDYKIIGETAANMVMDIFKGTKVSDIPLMSDTPFYYMFDYDLIQKYELDENELPADTVLVNKEENPLEDFKEYIYGGLIIFTLLILFAFLVVMDNIKRRRIEKSLKESNDKLTVVYKKLTLSEEELKDQYEKMRQHSEEINTLYQKYDIAIRSTDSAVWELDLITQELVISKNFYEIMNVPINEDKNVYSLIDSLMLEEHKEELRCEVLRCIKDQNTEINIKIPVCESGDDVRWILVRGKGIIGADNEIRTVSGICLDITTMKEQEDYIEYLAGHDYLTKLPNRMSFMEKVYEKLGEGKKGAIILLDIDNFKRINDTLGHLYGDDLLIQVSKRINSVADEHMLVSRFGGDEFSILISDIETDEEIERYAEQIKDAFRGAFSLEDNDNYISISMGITRFPMDSSDMNQLMMNADTAMYKVKQAGKNNYVYYHEDMKEEITTKRDVEVVLRQAIKYDGFKLVYQPQVDVNTREVVSFEALLRFKDNTIGPAVFISIAEETGCIVDIGRWVAKEAISQIAKWRDMGFKEKTVAINYSNKQLRDFEFVEYLENVLRAYKVDPQYIEIEITESILLENNTQSIELLHQIKSAGIKLALDDFGTGYSSLNYLTYIPMDKIKMDKSINDKFLEFENVEVMYSLISLVHSLNLTITAEGIEDWDKFHKLKKGGCDFIQGYLFSRPLEAESVVDIYDKKYV